MYMYLRHGWILTIVFILSIYFYNLFDTLDVIDKEMNMSASNVFYSLQWNILICRPCRFVNWLLLRLDDVRDVEMTEYYWSFSFPEKAIVVYEPRRFNPLVGNRLEITCDTRSSNTDQKVTWFKQDVPISAGENPNISFLQNGRKIVFNSVTHQDQDKYMCAVDDPNIDPLTMYIQPHADGKCILTVLIRDLES